MNIFENGLIQPFMDGSQEEPEFVYLAQAEAAQISKSTFGQAIGLFVSFDAHGADLWRRVGTVHKQFKEAKERAATVVPNGKPPEGEDWSMARVASYFWRQLVWRINVSGICLEHWNKCVINYYATPPKRDYYDELTLWEYWEDIYMPLVKQVKRQSWHLWSAKTRTLKK
jgi:hypothetical protein